MTVALAWPPPSHIVWKPTRPPVASRWRSRRVISATPDAPSGWPSAIAPPPRVEALHRVVELLLPHQRDGRERLVALDGVELVDLHAGPLHQLVRDRHRRREHEHRIFGGDREVHEPRPDGRPCRSAKSASAISIAAAPSVICDELPGGDVGRGLVGRVPRRRERRELLERRVAADPFVGRERLAGRFAGLGILDRHRHDLAREEAVVGVLGRARRCDWSAYSSISSRVMPHLSASTCATQNWMPSVLSVLARNSPENGPDPATRVRRHRRARHRLDAARDRDVVRAGDHALGDEVRGLLRRAALPVDARRRALTTGRPAATHALRVTLQPCSPDCVTQPPTTSSMRDGSMSLRCDQIVAARDRADRWDASRRARPCVCRTRCERSRRSPPRLIMTSGCRVP